ncbi:Holliday junction resolvase RuvX [Caloranaerobacter azorensis]|uniref:Putative pre-16S rRNA nuclease n=1 Tax=Caloranaerobacter azorensis TaxID=116090 RepID=A0A6P1YB37_9FIRM|nr:Holliday junction resolvase RuvX [Caloranaerobacter azorensis]QIB26489.1 Holliday junction resolvase RuvX [Caloranaerobacter azorensis]
MKRILGLDVGDKTIGVAISDPLCLTAQGVKTIKRKSIKSDLNELEEIINNYGVNEIVIGLPKNMNNSLGPQSEKVIKFAERVKERFKINIVFEDERLTTVIAEKALINADVSRKKRKNVIDKLAAVFILQSYLDKIDRKVIK